MSSTDFYIYTTSRELSTIFCIFYIFRKNDTKEKISAEHKLQQEYDNAGGR